ncbi:MAG: hypothetical protein ACO1OB_03140 [Archangium sp.]
MTVRNHPKQLGTSTTAIMARLLLCLFSGVSLSGCLIPQDDQVIPELPPLKNRAPRIVSTTPSSVEVAFKGSPACATQNPSFSLVVSDADTGDSIRSVWFVGEPTQGRDYRSAPSLPTASSERQILAPTNDFQSALQNLMTGVHVVKVIVTDREISDVSLGVVSTVNREVALPDGTTATDYGEQDSFSWVLRVSPCP